MSSLYLKHLAVVAMIVTVVFIVWIRMMELGIGVDFDLEHYYIELPFILAVAVLLSGMTYWLHRRMDAGSHEQ